MVEYEMPGNKITGMIFGEKSIKVDGRMEVKDRENKIKAVIFFKTKKNEDYFEGVVYRSNS
jgi:hypothetical protein